MSEKSEYIPARGDIVWLNFFPQTGHEQSGKRPALVLSHIEYNRKTGMAIFCPITSKSKGYPFEIKLKLKKITGVVLSDQIKNLDYKARQAEFVEKATDTILKKIIENINLLID